MVFQQLKVNLQHQVQCLVWNAPERLLGLPVALTTTFVPSDHTPMAMSTKVYISVTGMAVAACPEDVGNDVQTKTLLLSESATSTFPSGVIETCLNPYC